MTANNTTVCPIASGDTKKPSGTEKPSMRIRTAYKSLSKSMPKRIPAKSPITSTLKLSQNKVIARCFFSKPSIW